MKLINNSVDVNLFFWYLYIYIFFQAGSIEKDCSTSESSLESSSGYGSQTIQSGQEEIYRGEGIVYLILMFLNFFSIFYFRGSVI